MKPNKKHMIILNKMPCNQNRLDHSSKQNVKHRVCFGIQVSVQMILPTAI